MQIGIAKGLTADPGVRFAGLCVKRGRLCEVLADSLRSLVHHSSLKAAPGLPESARPLKARNRLGQVLRHTRYAGVPGHGQCAAAFSVSAIAALFVESECAHRIGANNASAVLKNDSRFVAGSRIL